MKVIFCLLLVTVANFVGASWKYYNYDLFSSRLYPYQSQLLAQVSFANHPTILSGSVRHAGIANIVGSGDLELVLICGTNTVDIVSATGQSLYKKVFNGTVGTVALDDADKDNFAEVLVGVNKNGKLYVDIVDVCEGEDGILASVTCSYFVSNGNYRVQPRCIYDVDYNGKKDLVVTLGEGENFKPAALYVIDYESGSLTWSACVRKSAVGTVNGDYPSILLAGGSPYSPKSLSTIDTDGYIIGYDRDGDISWKRKTGTWWIRSFLINLDGEGLEEMVVVQGPPNSTIYILDSYTGNIQKFQETLLYKEIQDAAFLTAAPIDVNNDKKFEIVVGATDGTLRVFDRHLNLIISATFTQTPMVYAVADVDGDSFHDVIIGVGNKVYVVNGALQVIGSGTLPSNVEEVLVSDLNHDKKLDLVVALSDGKTAMLSNEGSSVPVIADPSPAPVADTKPSKVVLSSIYVWPGNTNRDTIVDKYDIINLLIYWGKSGPARDVEDRNKWCPQMVGTWTDICAAFADCNGDGVVNAADILTIAYNWNKTHPKDQIHKSASKVVTNIQEFAKAYPEKLQNVRELFAYLTQKLPDNVETKQALVDLIELFYAAVPPQNTQLAQSYPNPATFECWIPFELTQEASCVKIKIFNISGQLVRVIELGSLPAGRYVCNGAGTHKDNSNLATKSPDGNKYFAAYWDTRDGSGAPLPSGVYLYQLLVKTKDKNFSFVKRTVVIR